MPLEIVGKAKWQGEKAFRVRLTTWDGGSTADEPGRHIVEDWLVPSEQLGHPNTITAYRTDAPDADRCDIAANFGGFTALASKIKR